VQPDVFVVCERKKITDQYIMGAPELIIEVLSPSTAVKDKREKKALFEQSGVQEYLIVFPENEIVEHYRLTAEGYAMPEIFNWDETVALDLFELRLDLWEIFEKERPLSNEMPGERG
jgi:Uma2 family endonuclease